MLIDKGTVKVFVDSTFELRDVAEAKPDLEGVWINADEIAKAIPSGHDGRSTDMQAGRAADDGKPAKLYFRDDTE
ncbi:hypothetical protein [Rhizobium tubonense]|uniref:hypothetical protein n=1 Tax=Rhizobium tubonense TaxID=484088 RepID=UPI001FCE9EDD|nr:hypothetical protein [Rhizobium tubonense]